MARPPQFERLDEADPDVATIKTVIKRLAPKDRANLLRWLCLYYDDKGERVGIIKRQRIAIKEIEFWLVRIPKG